MIDTAKHGAELLEVRDLHVTYQTPHRPDVRAVDGVSLSIAPNETLGLVGESGSGKTTIGRAVLGLTPVTSGSVVFQGADITDWSLKQRRGLSTELQIVFQDPYSSLNPVRTIGQTLAESLHGQRLSKQKVRDRIDEVLQQVRLSPDVQRRYPGHFSGGQRQRIAIARALMGSPRLVICDEPVSALDLSVQAQVLNLLSDLQQDLRLSYLFVSHDLAVVRHMAQRIVVLYRGSVMEQGSAEEIYTSPRHPYTQALLAARPIADPKAQRSRQVDQVRTQVTDASADHPDRGCPFAARCAYAIDVCRNEKPPLERTSAANEVACHRWREIASGVDANITSHGSSEPLDDLQQHAGLRTGSG